MKAELKTIIGKDNVRFLFNCNKDIGVDIYVVTATGMYSIIDKLELSTANHLHYINATHKRQYSEFIKLTKKITVQITLDFPKLSKDIIKIIGEKYKEYCESMHNRNGVSYVCMDELGGDIVINVRRKKKGQTLSQELDMYSNPDLMFTEKVFKDKLSPFYDRTLLEIYKIHSSKKFITYPEIVMDCFDRFPDAYYQYASRYTLLKLMETKK